MFLYYILYCSFFTEAPRPSYVDEPPSTPHFEKHWYRWTIFTTANDSHNQNNPEQNRGVIDWSRFNVINIPSCLHGNNTDLKALKTLPLNSTTEFINAPITNSNRKWRSIFCFFELRNNKICKENFFSWITFLLSYLRRCQYF